MPEYLCAAIELDRLRRDVIELNRENAMLRDMIKIAIEVADLAILSTIENAGTQRSDGDVTGDGPSQRSRGRQLQ